MSVSTNQTYVPPDQLNRSLSTSLCRGIVDWIMQNPYFKDVIDNSQPAFKQVDSYYRVDFPTSELTAISVYPLYSDTDSEPTKENGQIAIDISFNLAAQRTQRGELIYGTVEMMRGNLITNPVYIQKFLQDYVPGLQYINGQTRTDYTQLHQQILRFSGTYTIKFTLKYRIGIYTNQLALWNRTGAGRDLFSPTTDVYHTMTGVDLVEFSFLQPIINAYYVTPSMGYVSSGLLIVADNWTGQGVLLGDNGNVYRNVYLPDSNASKVNIKSLYVPNPIPNKYPQAGLLLLKENANIGNAAILLGDNGVRYDLQYDGTDFSPIKIKTSSVSAILGYPVDGIILSRIIPEKGIAALLYGVDNNLYNVTIK